MKLANFETNENIETTRKQWITVMALLFFLITFIFHVLIPVIQCVTNSTMLTKNYLLKQKSDLYNGPNFWDHYTLNQMRKNL